MGQAVTTTGAPRSVLNDMAVRFGMEMAAFESTVRATCMPGNSGSKEEFAAFLLVARDYELNPILKEIYAYPRRGGGIQTIVSIDGWIKLINRHPQFDGMEFEFHNKDDGTLDSVTCRIFRKDRRMPVVVTEFLEECVRATDPWKMKRRMLRHKALIQCGRYAFGFSGIMDEDEAERIGDVLVPSAPAVPPPPPRGGVIEHQAAPTVSQRATPTGPAPTQQRDTSAVATASPPPSPAEGGGAAQVPHVSDHEADTIAQREQGGSELTGDPTDDIHADAPAEDGDTLESVLEEVDSRLGHASTVDEVEEAYVNTDAEARLSHFAGGVEAARKIKGEHMERARMTEEAERGAADTARDVREEPAGGGTALQALRTGGAIPAGLESDDEEETFPGDAEIDPFHAPESFPDKLSLERWVHGMEKAAKTPADIDRIRNAWTAGKSARLDLKERGKVDAEWIKFLQNLLNKKMQQLADGGAPAAAADGAAAGTPGEYDAKLQEAIANVRNKQELRDFWDSTAGERDSCGAMEPQQLAWRSLKQRTMSDLPE